jgi:hypothetical protein
MARPFHVHFPQHRAPSERPSHPAAGWLLILLLAILAAVWMNTPTVASLLPVQPPG